MPFPCSYGVSHNPHPLGSTDPVRANSTMHTTKMPVFRKTCVTALAPLLLLGHDANRVRSLKGRIGYGYSVKDTNGVASAESGERSRKVANQVA